jgi:hypothetical protein
MNTIFPEDLHELNSRKIERDRLFILKEQKLNTASESTHLLDALGNWMIAKGEKLHKRYSAAMKANQPAFSQDEARLFKA